MNPNSPSFVPMAYQAVEDFSDQWGPSSTPPPRSATTGSMSTIKIPNSIYLSPTISTSSTTVSISSSSPTKWKKGQTDGLSWSSRYSDKPEKIVNLKMSDDLAAQ
ncbi:hypothetical protein LINGRAHAP2_LOCUS14655, partial [Linum grandiflorum]